MLADIYVDNTMNRNQLSKSVWTALTIQECMIKFQHVKKPFSLIIALWVTAKDTFLHPEVSCYFSLTKLSKLLMLGNPWITGRVSI